MTTFNLEIPELLPLQATPHLTVNAALRRIDAILSTGVLSFQTLTAPPGSPEEGDMHVPGTGATDDWDGMDNTLVYYSQGAWHQVFPVEGLLVWSVEDTALYVYTYSVDTNGSWEELFALP